MDRGRRDPGPAPVPARRGFLGGPAGSLLLHLLPLLVLVTWLRPPIEMPKPIPVRLVIEQPPPAPPPAPAAPQPKPQTRPHGPLASDDFGNVGANKGPPTPETKQPAEDKPPSPTVPAPPTEPEAAAAPANQAAEQTQTARLVAPPVIEPPTQPRLPAVTLDPPPLPPPPPEPPAPRRRAVPRPAAMSGLVLPLPLRADRASPAAASARYPGPSASRDEYCAYALSLALRHLDLLPDSLVAARRGETTVTIRLRADGSIVSAMVARSSGYLDIDERVTQMVKAVGKFPPLPSWVTTPVADFTFRLHFPHR
ncbi:MAG TPA: energy transducer TonB [Stellaceae bacterium]|nr:energy transducer TonB [Stellaceae bacterium]